MEKYNLTSYKYYKLLKEADIKNLYPKKGPIGVLHLWRFKTPIFITTLIKI